MKAPKKLLPLSGDKDGGLAQGEVGRDRRKGTESKKCEKVCPWTVMVYGDQQ